MWYFPCFLASLATFKPAIRVPVTEVSRRKKIKDWQLHVREIRNSTNSIEDFMQRLSDVKNHILFAHNHILYLSSVKEFVLSSFPAYTVIRMYLSTAYSEESTLWVLV